MISKLKEFSKILKEVHLVNLIASRDLFLESDWLRRVQLFSELYPKTGAIKTLLHSSIFKPINVRLLSRRLQKRSIDKKERTQKKIECEYQQKKKKGKENEKQKGNIMERFYVAEKSDIQELKNFFKKESW